MDRERGIKTKDNRKTDECTKEIDRQANRQKKMDGLSQLETVQEQWFPFTAPQASIKSSYKKSNLRLKSGLFIKL